ncbi:MAG: DUF6597 domain-containing transcriptional factor [Bacteroidia bacterium]
MHQENTNITYKQTSPVQELEDFIEIYWEHKNNTSEPNKLTIFPDSFFKLVIEISESKISNYFLTGIWTTEINVIVPPKTTIVGIKFKVLAPEYILQKSVAEVLQSRKILDLEYFSMNQVTVNEFENMAEQLNDIFKARLQNIDSIDPKKLYLSRLLYERRGNVTAEEVALETNWKNRQISRYLNKYLGVSLKKYLNIQKVYASYIQIREGDFFPEEGFYDQSHFIREIKKHTNHTPRKLYEKKDDRFVQLKNIKKK